MLQVGKYTYRKIGLLTSHSYWTIFFIAHMDKNPLNEEKTQEKWTPNQIVSVCLGDLIPGSLGY